MTRAPLAEDLRDGPAPTAGTARVPSPLAVVQPEGWPAPRGYANGIAAAGRMVFVGGQVGWDETGRFPDGFLPQTERALLNVRAVVEAAGGAARHVARLTWYVTDIEAYRGALKGLGPVYRGVMGRHFPAMALVQVVALVEPEALVEIEAIAVLP